MISNNADDQSFHFRAYLAVLKKRLWMVITIPVVLLFITTVVTLQTEKTYRANVQVLLEQESSRIVNLDEVLSVESSKVDYYQTQYKIMASRSLAERVIRQLNLVDSPEFVDRGSMLSWIPGPSDVIDFVVGLLPIEKEEKAQEEQSSESREVKLIGRYLDRLTITPIQRSRLVTVSFDAYAPKMAAAIANAHVKAYIDRRLEIKFAASKEAVDWLGQKLAALKTGLERSEKALQEFQEKENIVALENFMTTRGASEENILAQRLAELTSARSHARTQVIELETSFQQLQRLSRQPGMIESLPQVMDNALIQTFKGRLVELTREYSELKQKYGKKHPRMVALQKEIEVIRSRIASEIKKITNSVGIKYRAALTKLKSLDRALEAAKKDSLVLSKQAARYRYLRREVETNRELYTMVLQRAKETDLTSGIQSTNVHVVDAAEVPRGAHSPKLNRRLALALLAGLMLSIGLAFLLEYMDNTLHNGGDVRKHLGLPMLGTVGYHASRNGAKAEPGSELIVINDGRSDFAEGLRNVRTNISFSLLEPGAQQIVITSPVPGDGKTRIVANLAAVTAQTGKRVILVDADLRRPRTHRIFGIHSKPGLTNLVAGQVELADVLIDVEPQGLSIIPAGSIPPNPSELLSSERCCQVLAGLKEHADLVFIDTPPTLSFADPAIVAGASDAVILVTRASMTTIDAAREAVESLQDVNANVLGLILNWQDKRKEKSYYRYHRYYNKSYSYRYKYRYDSKKRKS